jgi:superoxide dismutase, Cu-Zn family
MQIKIRVLISFLLFFISIPLYALIVVTMYSTQPDHKKIGQITFKNKSNGLLIIPALRDLPPGIHGFHLHDHPSCEQEGKAAGGHFDPHHTEKHLGPNNSAGHLGDLPALQVNKAGIANQPVFVTHLHENDLRGHALIIHAGGDNYSDFPKPLGGGGDRIACGVIKK